MLAEIQKLIDTVPPKQIGNSLKRNVTLKNWILDNTSSLSQNTSLSERAYLLVNGIDSRICDNGKIKKFISISKGYGFCGKAISCQCASISISKKVSAAKKVYSNEEKERINKKREQTNTEKYGVANIGQTVFAKSKHTEFYSDVNLVNQQLQKQQSTMLERYGVYNPMLSTEIRKKAEHTNIERYGAKNPMQVAEISNKAIQTKKEKYEPYYLAKLNYEHFIRNIKENFNLTAIISKDEYIGVGTRPEILFKCESCSNEFRKRFDYASPPRCKVCFPADIKYKSREELELLDFIKSIYSGNVLSGDRSAIAPYELDILLPDINIAFEYCGLYWHSEKSGNKSWNYHYRKWKVSNDKNIQLYTIFSDEWVNKKKIIKNMISSKINVMQKNLFARQCKLTVINKFDAACFYDSYHIIGAPTKLPINYALTHDTKIVAVMSFANKSTHHELIRFATDGRVPGAASKLLFNFIKDYNPDKITSFSDNRYSNGNVYEKLGFKIVNTVPPMQSYVKDYQIRFHKLSLNKKNLQKLYKDIDVTQTEWTILQNLGYDRIWDCGKIKWEWSK